MNIMVYPVRDKDIKLIIKDFCNLVKIVNIDL